MTITDGKIAKVELVSQEKQSYWDSKNVSSLFDEIVKANGTEIDGAGVRGIGRERAADEHDHQQHQGQKPFGESLVHVLVITS